MFAIFCDHYSYFEGDDDYYYVTVYQLINQPVSVNLHTLDDDVYEGREDIFLTLAQVDSSNTVTNGLVSPTVHLVLEDNDGMS